MELVVFARVRAFYLLLDGGSASDQAPLFPVDLAVTLADLANSDELSAILVSNSRNSSTMFALMSSICC